MACFPGLAAAEENSGIQYETDDAPTIPSDKGSNIPSGKSGNSSDEPDAEASGSGTPEGESSGGGGGSETGGTGTGTGQGNQAQGGNGGKASNGSKPAGGDVSGAQPLKTISSTSGKAADDDGSSPLVPILIAVAALAAISIGAFYYRQRRQGSGSPVSPKAS